MRQGVSWLEVACWLTFPFEAKLVVRCLDFFFGELGSPLYFFVEICANNLILDVDMAELVVWTADYRC